MAPEGATSSLPDELRRLVSATEDLAARTGLESWIEGLRAHAQRLDEHEPPVVVVVGETKRGKSMLVNELVGTPQLSPVDVDVATALWVRLACGDGSACVYFVEDGSQDTTRGREMTLEEARRWIAAPSMPTSGPAPIGAVLRAPSPLLREVTLLDTPGVGGLRAAHRHVTLEALRKATALLFVVDSGAPMARPETEFLADAVEQLTEVLFVLTKVDAEAGWRAVLAEDQQIVRRVLPDEINVTWIPASSRRHEAARTLAATLGPDAERVERMERDSGIPAVRDWLLSLARERVPEAETRNIARHTKTTLGRFGQALLERRRWLTDESEWEERQQRHRMDKDELSRNVQRWCSRLPPMLLELQQQVVGELGVELDRTRDGLLRQIARAEGDWREAVDRLGPQLKMISVAHIRRYEEGASDRLRTMTGDSPLADPALVDAIAIRCGARSSSWSPPVGDPARTTPALVDLFGNTKSVMDATELVGAFLAPLAVSRRVFAHAADLLFPGAGLVLGLCLAFAMQRAQGRARDQEFLQDAVRETTEQTRRLVISDLEARHDQVVHALTNGLEAWGHQVVAEIDAALERVAQERMRSQSDRQTQLAELDRQQEAVDAAARAVDDVLTALASSARRSERPDDGW